MEPERNIEKLLRACAKKRRSEPGATPELHPATRRLLQSEAARRRGRPEQEGFFFLRFLGDCRPQLATILGVVVVCVFGFALMLPTLGKAKSKAQNAAAINNLRQIGMAALSYAQDNTNRLPASLAQMHEYIKSTNVVIDPVSRKQFVYVGAGKILADLSSDAPLAYSPEDQKGRAVLFADGRVQKLGSKQFAELAEENALQIASVNEALRPNTDGRAEQDSYATRGSQPAAAATSPAPDSQLFVRIDSDPAAPPPGAMQPLPSQKPPSALASFRIRQSGKALQIVDADGSVYTGLLRSAKTADIGKPDAGAGYAFSVSGTNRTLKLPLVFTGQLTPDPNQSVLAVTAPDQTAVPPRLELWRWRVSGTAVLSQTNLFHINALPASR